MRQEARVKRQEARGKRQEARGKKIRELRMSEIKRPLAKVKIKSI
jgi:hypothetical protein